MKIKISGTVYDSDEEIMMVVLTDSEKKLISEMLPEAHKLCVYPEDLKWEEEEIREWMKI